LMALLEVEGLEARYGWTKVLHGIRFAVEDGGITTILGANGAGKTTTLRAVCGMVRATGDVRFDGQRIDGRATEDIVRLGIAHVPEGRGTFVQLSVEENLRLGAYARRARAGPRADLRPFSGAGRAAAPDRGEPLRGRAADARGRAGAHAAATPAAPRRALARVGAARRPRDLPHRARHQPRRARGRAARRAERRDGAR